MSLDRLISVANDYKRKVPHAALKSLKLSLDGGEPVELGSIEIENDADGCVLTVNTKQETQPGQQAGEPQRQAAGKRPAGKRPASRQQEDDPNAVREQDRPEVRQAESGPLEES